MHQYVFTHLGGVHSVSSSEAVVLSLMPYWSIAEWRARIGSSWCALGRPLKIIKHGARILNKELTLYRILILIIVTVLLIGMNFGLQGLVEEGYHHQLMSKCLKGKFSFYTDL